MRNLGKQLIAALVLAGLSGAASAETWNLATGYPDTNFHTENIRWFADQVEKETGGALKIVVHSGASMFKVAELKRALRTGQVQAAEFILSSYGNEDPIYEADSIPFLAVGAQEAKQLYDAQKPMLEKRFQKEGIVSLYQVIWPGNSLYTANPITRVSDLKGVKMRGQTPIVARLAELTGAVPVNVQFVEVPQAFATGVITAMITAGSNGAETQAWEYTKYYYDISAYHPRNVVAVNARAWKALPEDVRAKVLEVAKRAEARGWEKAVELQKTSTATLAEHGMKVEQPSPELLSGFKKIGDQIIAEWAKKAGPDGATLVQAMKK